LLAAPPLSALTPDFFWHLQFRFSKKNLYTWGSGQANYHFQLTNQLTFLSVLYFLFMQPLIRFGNDPLVLGPTGRSWLAPDETPMHRCFFCHIIDL